MSMNIFEAPGNVVWTLNLACHFEKRRFLIISEFVIAISQPQKKSANYFYREF